MIRIAETLDFQTETSGRYAKETIVSGNIHLFVVGVAEIVSKRSF